MKGSDAVNKVHKDKEKNEGKDYFKIFKKRSELIDLLL